MPNRLIIVESPSKARTLAKFLGSAYTIKASMGHVRDLPKSRLGVDIESGFVPEYEVTKEAQIRDLRKEARKADAVLLASDPDREGEAIAWHLAEALKLKDPERIVFHEITKPAVEAALTTPRAIDRDLVSAQEARRVIDRLVGYQVSPLLWKKVRTGLSAGRVQSVAVRLVVDREREIEAFVAEEWWSLEAELTTEAGETLTALLHARPGDATDSADGAERSAATGSGEGEPAERGRRVLADEAAALAVLDAFGVDRDGRPGPATPDFRVASVEARQTSRSAPLPYTTSTLQQDASSRLRMSPRRTMSVAQQLYEGVEMGAEGSVGLITYMRTDSTRVSDLARRAAGDYIRDSFGGDYVGKPGGRRKAPAGPVQDAHEAVRPTDVRRTPDSVRELLDRDQVRLYELIWRRFVASEMSPARFQSTRVDITAADHVFRASGSVLLFDGFTRVWRRDDDREERRLPALGVDQLLRLLQMTREQHFTQPPPRYTEATLVKELEERGIGRPSTYAPTVDTIQERGYIRQEERRLHPSELGKTVDALLREHFPDIVDVAFTAEMEKRLDRIEEGKRRYEPTVREWYGPFARTLAKAEKDMGRVLVSTGETCPECGQGELVVRQSRYGEFVGCSRYPECRYIKREPAAAPEPTGQTCPQCGRELVARQSRRGPFVGCSGYPECTYVQATASARSTPPPQPTGEACPRCSKPLVLRHGRRGPFTGCSGYPRCRYIAPRADGAEAGTEAAAPAEDLGACPECGKPLVRRRGRYGSFVGCSGYPDCRYRPSRTAATETRVGTAS